MGLTATLVVAAATIVGVSLLGGALPLATVLTHTRMQLYLSFAAGTMLGAALLHMLPEAVAAGSAGTLRWSAVGLLGLFFLERFFAYHHHEAPGDGHGHEHRDHDHAPGSGRDVPRGNALPWGAAAIGLAVHSLAGGVALASAMTADFVAKGALGAAGWGVLLATGVHKPADALTIVSLMLRAGVRRPVAHLVNLAFSLMIPAGMLAFALGITWIGADRAGSITAATLAFSAGTFLCIALSDLLPELHFHAHDRVKLSIALLAGVGLMVATGAFEPAEAHGRAPAAIAPHDPPDR